MKLNRLTMTNFRQFYGDVIVDFATDATKNVTVIHGSNAAGKTALLNALRWCLYGKVNLPSAEHIVCNRLVAESEQDRTLTVSVVLEFDHEDEHYRLERSHRFRKHSELTVTPVASQDLSLSRIGDDGQNEKEINPQDRVRQILPEDIHPYFFFDGEDITGLSEAEDRVQDGIRNLMSITLFDRGIRHLAGCAKRFRQEFSASSTDEARMLDRDIEQYDTLLQELEESEQQSVRRISALQHEKSLVAERLRKLDPARDLQREREKLEDEEVDLKHSIAANSGQLRALLRTHGVLPFIVSASRTARSLIDDKRDKGTLPAGIKDVFVNDLLKRNLCLCGRDLKPGTEPWRSVERFLAEKAGSSEVENRVQTLAGQLQTVDGSVEDLNRGLKENLRRRQEYLARQREVNLRLSEVASELKGKDDVTEIAELEGKREQLEDDLREENRRLGGIRTRRDASVSSVEELRRRLAKVSALEQKADLAKRRYQHCEEAQHALEEICAILVHEVRDNVAQRINSVLDRVTGNDFRVELSEDFRLKTVQRVGGHTREIAKSTGQSQITSLSFIGSLLDILKEHDARRRETGGANTMLRGGVYPIVMDSPFGSLDNIYGPRIAALAPQLAPQVVVMVSGKQWLGGIAEALYPYTGRQFVLVKNKPHPTDEDLQDGTVVLGGITVETVVKSDTYEYTSVREVSDARQPNS